MKTCPLCRAPLTVGMGVCDGKEWCSSAPSVCHLAGVNLPRSVRDAISALRVQRDEAVAALVAIKNSAPFPSDRFVATVIAMMPEWFNDADATDSFRALTKALRDAAADLPRDTPAVIIERATGVPEAELLAPRVACEDFSARWCPNHGTCTCNQSDFEDGDYAQSCPLHGDYSLHETDHTEPAAPPVAEDAEAEEMHRLINVLVIAARDEGPKAASRVVAARNAIFSRMRPPVTAEALHAAMANTWNDVPLRSFGWGTLKQVRDRAFVRLLKDGE